MVVEHGPSSNAFRRSVGEDSRVETDLDTSFGQSDLGAMRLAEHPSEVIQRRST